MLEPLRAGKDCSYRPYDCKQQKLAEPVAVRQDRLIVVEGSYSCHPTLWERYDLHVFLTVNPQEQLRRIERRNGSQGLAGRSFFVYSSSTNSNNSSTLTWKTFAMSIASLREGL